MFRYRFLFFLKSLFILFLYGVSRLTPYFIYELQNRTDEQQLIGTIIEDGNGIPSLKVLEEGKLALIEFRSGNNKEDEYVILESDIFQPYFNLDADTFFICLNTYTKKSICI